MHHRRRKPKCRQGASGTKMWASPRLFKLIWLRRPLRRLNKEYCQNINIVQFSEVFCPKYKSGFQALWRKYVVLFNVSRNVDNGIVAAYMKSKNAAEVFDYSATYVELLSFLFFLVSVDKKSSFAFLFWIVIVFLGLLAIATFSYISR